MSQRVKQKNKILNNRKGKPLISWRLIATISGVFLLLITFPMRWMFNAVIINEWKIRIRSGPEVWDEIISFPLIYLIIGVLLFTLIVIWKNRILHQAWLNLKQNKNYLRNFLIAASVFSITMVPFSVPQKSLTIDQSLVAYLLIGSLGILALFFGIYHSSKWLTKIVARAYNFLFSLPIGYFLLICVGIVLLLTNIFSLFCFQHRPHIDDTIAQLFHARILAQGKLYLSAPAFPEFFNRDHIIIDNGRWYSQYPPGHPVLLALGVLIGMPWLINPLLGAIAVVIFFFLGKELYDEKTGRIAALLGTLSPFLMFMSAEFMNHASALVFLSCFILFFFKMIRKRDLFSAILAGTFLGLGVNVRPLTALAIATPLIFYSLYLLKDKLALYLPRLSLMAIATIIFVGILLYFNYLTNGNPLTFGYMVRWGSDHGLGFGHSGWGPLHTPLRGLLSTSEDLNALNRFLFEWPIPSLVFIFLLFASSQAQLKDYLLLAIIGTPIIAYFFYWFHGILFGPRWEYETLGALVVLTARGIRLFPNFIQNQLKIETTKETISSGLQKFLALCVLSTMVIAMPSLIRFYRYAHGSTRVPIIERTQKAQVKDAVVVTPRFIYGSSFGGNQLDLQGNIVYARDLRALTPLLKITYPERRFYRALIDSFYEIEVPPFTQSPLYEVLMAQSKFTHQLTDIEYKTIFWPMTDLYERFRPFLFDTTINIVPLRQFYIDIYDKTASLDQYLPALVFWIFDDRQEHLQIFSFMNDFQSYIAADYKFTLRYTTPDNIGAVYVIDKVAGNEDIIDTVE